MIRPKKGLILRRIKNGTARTNVRIEDIKKHPEVFRKPFTVISLKSENKFGITLFFRE